MAHVHSTGTLVNSTGSTGIWVTLTGKAKKMYIQVGSVTYFKFRDTTGSTAIDTGVGLSLSTSIIHEFDVEYPKYFNYVATGVLTYHLVEIF